MAIRDYRPTDFPQVQALWETTCIYTEESGDTAEIILQCIARGGKFLVMVNPSTNQIITTSKRRESFDP